MGHEVDILPHLLLPLAGPEELDEEVRRLSRCTLALQPSLPANIFDILFFPPSPLQDMDGMPDDLQFLPPDKVCSCSTCLAWPLVCFRSMFFSKCLWSRVLSFKAHLRLALLPSPGARARRRHSENAS